MTLDEAKHILSMIRHEQRYRRMVTARWRELQDISQKIDALASPRSQQIDSVGVHSQNPVPVDSILNALLSDECEAIKAYNKARMLCDDAIRYRNELFSQVKNREEKAFVEGYLRAEMTHQGIRDMYGYQNPYERMITIIKKTDIKI